jgi:hypothetical protein
LMRKCGNQCRNRFLRLHRLVGIGLNGMRSFFHPVVKKCRNNHECGKQYKN